MRALVVDAANVVGSRPDGWWRDRAGAAGRLHDRLVRATLPHDEVLLVLEGAGRRGRAPGSDGNVRTLHASGAGDDAIVAAVTALVGDGREVTVVTADRLLRRRVEEAGAGVVGPGWLLDQL